METANILIKKEKLKAKELFQSGYVKPLLVSMGLMFFQQLSGINAVMFYSVNIFRLAGSSIDSNLATIILGVVNIGATIFSNVVIDRLGRKMLLYISSSGLLSVVVVVATAASAASAAAVVVLLLTQKLPIFTSITFFRI